MVFAFYAIPVFVHANVVITEIMYAPSTTDADHEWIEVYNNGASAVDLSTYHIQTDGASGSHHALVAQDSSSLAPLSYAVIVQKVDTFKTDYSNFTGQIFDSSWSELTNSVGKNIIVLDGDGNVSDQITYDPTIGATDDGNSLQKKDDDTWVAAVPTPGSATIASVNQNSGGGGGGGGGSSQNIISTTDTIKKDTTPPPPPKITAHIIGKKNIVAGLAVHFKPQVIGLSGENLYYGKFAWSFGDGMNREDTKPNDFYYYYQYPGDYVVVLDYYANSYTDIPEASDRLIVSVTPVETQISSIMPDGGIEISNKSSFEIDLSNWNLYTTTNKKYTLPKSTFVISGKKIILSPKITQFTKDDEVNLSLYSPSNELISTYPEIKNVGVVNAVEQIPITTPVTSNIIKDDYIQPVVTQSTQEINNQDSVQSGDNLFASVDAALPLSEKNNQRNYLGIWVLALGSLVGVSSFSVFKIRKSKNVKKDNINSTDFEITE